MFVVCVCVVSVFVFGADANGRFWLARLVRASLVRSASRAAAMRVRTVCTCVRMSVRVCGECWSGEERPRMHVQGPHSGHGRHRPLTVIVAHCAVSVCSRV